MVNKALNDEIEIVDTFYMIFDSLYIEEIGIIMNRKLYDIKLDKVMI
jgi:hypothetical protein